MSRIVVICLRDPDSNNDYAVIGAKEGEVQIVDLDLGARDLRAEDEWREWADSRVDELAGLWLTNSAAADHLERVLVDIAEDLGHTWPPHGRYYDFPEDVSGTVFDPDDPTFGPILAALQTGRFEMAEKLIRRLIDHVPEES